MRTRLFPLFTTFLLALAFTHATAAAPYLPDGPTELAADVTVEAEQVTWQPRDAYERALLTVKGPGGMQIKQTFSAGTDIRLMYQEMLLSDGDFTYRIDLLGALEEWGDVEPVLMEDGTELTPLATQTGHFAVTAGAFVEQAAHAHEAFVFFHVGNGSIDGSLCLGNDCASSETFSFDTLRLKENNLRIKFMDTSTAASFPSNDWQLRANESVNGGRNAFFIDDMGTANTNGQSPESTPFTIEANAATNAFYIDDAERVGLGTSSPALELHIVDGDSPGMRLEQDASSGFTPQTWDVVGNETNFFIRDVTNGSSLPLRIRPSAPSNSIMIDADGNVGLGTSSPTAKLDVRGSVDVVLGGINLDDDQAITTDGGGPILRYNSGIGNAEIGKNLGTARPAIRFGNANIDFVDGNSGALLMRVAETTGDVSITGNLSKGGGAFRIDHPLDPENKYLSHSFVESPDMMNVYNGNVTTDADGYASVTLPSYFEVLNRDFRYQLTVIGTFAQAIVGEEITGNQFVIQTDTPNVKVSWQVTGVRQDPYAEAHRIQVEEAKSESERGTFLHPEVYQAGQDR